MNSSSPNPSLIDTVRLVVKALDDKKAADLCVLNVGKLSSITDYLVLATGNSEPHLRALRVELEKVLDAAKVRIVGMDTDQGSGWMVVDAFDVMIHVFTPEMRANYKLETLWKDAEKISIETLIGSPGIVSAAPSVAAVEGTPVVESSGSDEGVPVADAVVVDETETVVVQAAPVVKAEKPAKKVAVKKVAVKKAGVELSQPVKAVVAKAEKTVVKPAAKKVSKKVVKKAVLKKAAKPAVKKLVKKPVKKLAVAAKKKLVSKVPTKAVAKKNVVKAVAKVAVKKAVKPVKKVSKPAVKKVAKKVLKKAVAKPVKKVVKKAVKKPAVKTAKKVVKKAAKSAKKVPSKKGAAKRK